jgi:hypothetical protein
LEVEAMKFKCWTVKGKSRWVKIKYKILKLTPQSEIEGLNKSLRGPCKTSWCVFTQESHVTPRGWRSTTQTCPWNRQLLVETYISTRYSPLNPTPFYFLPKWLVCPDISSLIDHNFPLLRQLNSLSKQLSFLALYSFLVQSCHLFCFYIKLHLVKISSSSHFNLNYVFKLLLLHHKNNFKLLLTQNL